MHAWDELIIYFQPCMLKTKWIFHLFLMSKLISAFVSKSFRNGVPICSTGFLAVLWAGFWFHALRCFAKVMAEVGGKPGTVYTAPIFTPSSELQAHLCLLSYKSSWLWWGENFLFQMKQVNHSIKSLANMRNLSMLTDERGHCMRFLKGCFQK